MNNETEKEVRPIIRFRCKCAYCDKKFFSKVRGSTSCDECIKECFKKQNGK